MYWKLVPIDAFISLLALERLTRGERYWIEDVPPKPFFLVTASPIFILLTLWHFFGCTVYVWILFPNTLFNMRALNELSVPLQFYVLQLSVISGALASLQIVSYVTHIRPIRLGGRRRR